MSEPTLWRQYFRWPDLLAGPWNVCVHFAEVDGRMECVGIDLRSFEDDAADHTSSDSSFGPLPLTALTTKTWRAFPVGENIDATRGLLGTTSSVILAVDGSRLRDAEASKAKARRAVELLTHGRDGLGRDHFLAVAQVYGHAWSQKTSDPVAAVVDEFGCARSTAGRWVSRARNEYGFLEPTEPRVANGRLTRKARRLIDKKGTN